MLSSTVIFAHTDMQLTEHMERILRFSHPLIHIERVMKGEDALMLQSMMRADAVLIDMDLPDMPAEHLIRELKRDISDPYVLVCSRRASVQEEMRALRMGANGYVAMPTDAADLSVRLQTQLTIRQERKRIPSSVLEEAMLHRIFLQYGIPFHLKGYAYLKHALRLLAAGEANLEALKLLYERVAERFGCSADAVERNIRYAVKQCAQRRGDAVEIPRGNREFMAKVLMECRSDNPSMVAPRISINAMGRRIFM